ncbi:FAD-dependent monooxygenase [Streptomyces sp. NPDC050560]|uniref:FAD-dependent monooxygenase n=1 Tax=Streptomyces sp. NPDC050560 TaxID=3365630 RepID=UPI0037945DD0
MDVLVTGGGVAGAAAAIALRRIGADVTIHEAYADPAGQVGSFLSLASNGLRALRALGCLDEVAAAGFPVPHQRMWSGSGKLLGAGPRGRLDSDPLHSVTLMRAELVRVLREEAVRAGVRIVTDHRLVGAEAVGGAVRAEFTDGSQHTADLLVGADGLRSATRSALDPTAPSPRYAGFFTVSGVTESAAVEGVPTEPGCFNMVFARHGAFLHLPAPDGTLWWSAQVADPRPPDLEGFTGDEGVTKLAGVYRDDPVPYEIVRAAAALHRPTPMHTLAEVPRVHTDRMVLIGDAAHPVGAGQGASMAVEDAVVLAQCLAGEPSTQAALAGYERRRRSRVARMARAATANRDAKAPGPVRRRVRDLVMPYVFRHAQARATAWLYKYDIGALPERG